MTYHSVRVFCSNTCTGCRLCFVVCWGRLPDFVIIRCVSCVVFFALSVHPLDFTNLCCVFVRSSVGQRETQPEPRRHESSRVLFVTLSKSETYKETIVRVLVPQSLTEYSTVQIMLCGGLGATLRFPDFCGCYPAYLLQYPYIGTVSQSLHASKPGMIGPEGKSLGVAVPCRLVPNSNRYSTSARFHEVVSVCVTATV